MSKKAITIISDEYKTYMAQGICGIGDGLAIITTVVYSDGSHTGEYFLKVLYGVTPLYRHLKRHVPSGIKGIITPEWLFQDSLSMCNRILESHRYQEWNRTKLNNIWTHDYHLHEVDSWFLYSLYINDVLGPLGDSLPKKTVSKSLSNITTKLLNHKGLFKISSDEREAN